MININSDKTTKLFKQTNEYWSNVVEILKASYNYITRLSIQNFIKSHRNYFIIKSTENTNGNPQDQFLWKKSTRSLRV